MTQGHAYNDNRGNVVTQMDIDKTYYHKPKIKPNKFEPNHIHNS